MSARSTVFSNSGEFTRPGTIFTARAGDAARHVRHVLLRTLEQLLRLRAENVLCSEHLRAEVQDRVDLVD